jgi:hypothetical protein
MNILAYFFTGGGMGAVIDVLCFILLVVILIWAIKQFLGKP